MSAMSSSTLCRMAFSAGRHRRRRSLVPGWTRSLFQLLTPLAEQPGHRGRAERAAPAVAHQLSPTIVVDRHLVPVGGVGAGDGFADFLGQGRGHASSASSSRIQSPRAAGDAGVLAQAFDREDPETTRAPSCGRWPRCDLCSGRRPRRSRRRTPGAAGTRPGAPLRCGRRTAPTGQAITISPTWGQAYAPAPSRNRRRRNPGTSGLFSRGQMFCACRDEDGCERDSPRSRAKPGQAPGAGSQRRHLAHLTEAERIAVGEGVARALAGIGDRQGPVPAVANWADRRPV
jgi:hypothetical protein